MPPFLLDPPVGWLLSTTEAADPKSPSVSLWPNPMAWPSPDTWPCSGLWTRAHLSLCPKCLHTFLHPNTFCLSNQPRPSWFSVCWICLFLMEGVDVSNREWICLFLLVVLWHIWMLCL